MTEIIKIYKSQKHQCLPCNRESSLAFSRNYIYTFFSLTSSLFLANVENISFQHLGKRETTMARFLNKDSAIVAFEVSYEFRIVDVRDNLKVKQTVKSPDRPYNQHSGFCLLGDGIFLIGGGKGFINVYRQEKGG